MMYRDGDSGDQKPDKIALTYRPTRTYNSSADIPAARHPLHFSSYA